MKRVAMLAVITLGFFLTSHVRGAQSTCMQGSGSSNRACLLEIVDRYFAALAANEPSNVPLAPGATYSERPLVLPAPTSQSAAAGTAHTGAAPQIFAENSLWKTMSEGPADFKIYVPDTASQEIGGIAMIKVKGQPTVIGFRLKVERGSVTAAENILVRITDAAALANLTRPRTAFFSAVPPAERISPETLRKFAYSAYDSKGKSVQPVPLADGCVRRENGMPVAGSAKSANFCGPQLTTVEVSGLDSLTLRRFRIADPETGLVFSLSYNIPTRPGMAPRGGPEFGAVHISKVQGNRIHEIEAIGFDPQGAVGSLPAQPSLNSWKVLTR